MRVTVRDVQHVDAHLDPYPPRGEKPGWAGGFATITLENRNGSVLRLEGDIAQLRDALTEGLARLGDLAESLRADIEEYAAAAVPCKHCGAYVDPRVPPAPHDIEHGRTCLGDGVFLLPPHGLEEQVRDAGRAGQPATWVPVDARDLREGALIRRAGFDDVPGGSMVVRRNLPGAPHVALGPEERYLDARSDPAHARRVVRARPVRAAPDGSR